MKCVKKCLLLAAFISTQTNIPNYQQPFSPCQSDCKKITIENNFNSVMMELFLTARSDMRTQSALAIGICPDDIAISVNGKKLLHGANMSLDMSNKAHVIICLTSSTWNVVNLINQLGVADKVQSPVSDTIKSFTTTLINNTYCLFANDNADQVYERNKSVILKAYMNTYKNTFGLFGGTCTVQIVIDADKIQEYVDPENPIVNFYDILDIVLFRNMIKHSV